TFAEARHEPSIAGHLALRTEAAPVPQFGEDYVGCYRSNLGNAVEHGSRFTRGQWSGCGKLSQSAIGGTQPLLVLLQFRDKLLGDKAVGCSEWHDGQVRETFRSEQVRHIRVVGSQNMPELVLHTRQAALNVAAPANQRPMLP